VAGQVIRGNGQPTVAWIFGPDAFARHAAALGVFTNTFSPASAGVHSPGATARGFTGDRGYGVNRFAGRTRQIQPLGGAARPVVEPGSRRLGAGYGASGQPGMPSTGADASGYAPIAYLGYGQIHQVGMGF
jgi:hypothetical protein